MTNKVIKILIIVKMILIETFFFGFLSITSTATELQVLISEYNQLSFSTLR